MHSCASKTLILVNPQAGNRKGAIFLSALEGRLRRDKDSRIELETTRKGPLREQLQEKGHELERLIVVGGDGTVGQALEAIWRLGLSLEVGIVPMGTGNDMARSLGLYDGKEWTLDELFAYLSTSAKKKIDLWTIDGRRSFSNYVSIGMDASVVQGFCKLRSSLETRPWKASKELYFALYFLTWLKRRSHKVPQGTTFSWEDPEGRWQGVEVGGARVLAITNTPYYAAGCLMAPEACLGDGILEVTLFPTMRPYVQLMATRIGPLARMGMQRWWWRRRAKSLELGLSVPTALQVDGEDMSGELGQEKILKIERARQIEILTW